MTASSPCSQYISFSLQDSPVQPTNEMGQEPATGQSEAAREKVNIEIAHYGKDLKLNINKKW